MTTINGTGQSLSYLDQLKGMQDKKSRARAANHGNESIKTR